MKRNVTKQLLVPALSLITVGTTILVVGSTTFGTNENVLAQQQQWTSKPQLLSSTTRGSTTAGKRFLTTTRTKEDDFHSTIAAAPTATATTTTSTTASSTTSRETCGYNPPDDYCHFCDAYYLQSPDEPNGGCGEGDNSCVMQCPYAPRCTSDPSDYCEGYCCKDFGCVFLFGCKYQCSYDAVGCKGVCCERRDEVNEDFWDNAAEKGAQWFIKRASKFVFGGCGLFCAAFIEFLFAPRKHGIGMSVDCWKLPSQTVVSRTVERDPDYPTLDDTLLTSDVDITSFEERVHDYNQYYTEEVEKFNVDAAFVVKVKIPKMHSEFTSSSKNLGGAHWMEEWVKELYDEFSGCKDCCECASQGKAKCLNKCSLNVQLRFNYNIKGYDWPDWDFNYTEYQEDRFSVYREMPKGFFFNNSLVFKEYDFSDSMGEIATLPLFGKNDYDGILLGCHVYPSPTNSGSRRSFDLIYMSATSIFLLLFFLV